jgi:hypothetical protein
VDPEKVKAALDAIEAGDVEACKEILKEMVAAAAAAGAKPSGDAPPADAAAANADTAPPSDEESPETAALAHVALELTGLADPGAAIVAMREVFASAKKTKDASEAAELAEQRALIADLILCGVEFPSTAWEGKPEDRNPVKRLADEPIDSLRTRVAAVKAARGSKPRQHTPPVQTPEQGGRMVKTSKGEIELSAREIKNCETQKVKLEDYAENKAIREAARRK